MLVRQGSGEFHAEINQGIAGQKRKQEQTLKNTRDGIWQAKARLRQFTANEKHGQ